MDKDITKNDTEFPKTLDSLGNGENNLSKVQTIFENENEESFQQLELQIKTVKSIQEIGTLTPKQETPIVIPVTKDSSESKETPEQNKELQTLTMNKGSKLMLKNNDSVEKLTSF